MAQPKARVSIDKLEVVESVPLADLEVEETAPATEAAAPSGGFASDFAARSGQVPVVGPAVQKYLDVNIGAAKSAGQLVVGAGRAVQMVPGVSKAVDTLYGSPGISARAMNEADAYLKPTNATQTVAKAGADMAQFFLPVPGGSKARAAVAAKDAGLTYLQTGSIPAAAASAGLSAVLPGANAVANAAGRLKIGAEKTVAQALGATKEWAKTEATKLAPQILQRGIKGTREGMLAQATAQAKAVGKSLDDAYDVAEAAGQTISGGNVQTAINTAIDGFHVVTSAGKRIPIAGREAVVRKLQDLDTFVAKLGPDIPIKQARTIRQAWDEIVDDAGMYGQHVAASATEKAQAWAAREGASAFKQLINATPDIGALNKEMSFWIGLKDVLGETVQRTQAQGGGLVSNLTGTAGAVTGFSQGDGFGDGVTKAFIGAAAGKKLTQALQSPWFRTTVAAPFKDKLAKALASGSAGNIESVVHAMTQAMKAAPTQVQRALAQ
jgi:hypothetical protein